MTDAAGQVARPATDGEAPATKPDPSPRLQIRVHLAGKAMFGPGKAQLLQAIRETGSIAQAGQAMAMSYKRAWSLVEEMNRLFASPLVVSTRGGTRGGGAELTPAGAEILAQYRSVVAAATTAAAPHLDAITAALKPPP